MLRAFLNGKEINIFKQNQLIKCMMTKDTLTRNLTTVAVPYLTCYYFNPVFNINEDIIIPVYITDYLNSDYLYNNTSKKFTIKVKFDNEEKTYMASIGDYSLNIGKASIEGNQYALVTCIDNSTGMESYEQYIPFIVQDPSKSIIAEDEIYYMTDDDLTNYNIKNDDSKVAEDLINTRKGLTHFFNDKHEVGYKKIVLTKNGIFRMDYSTVSGDGTPIIIPSDTTVDMNGSTFRIHPQSEITSTGSTIVTNGENSNTCLENGVLQGSYKYSGAPDGDDWDTFPYTNADGKIILESAGSYNFTGGTNNTLRNMIVKNIQGYSITANSGTQNTLWVGINKNTCSSCYIKHGEEITDSSMLTTNIIKIPTSVKNDGNMCFNRYKGYQGYKGRDGIEFFHWYDNEQNYIKTTKGHQFRVNIIPEKAVYVRITLFYTLSDSTDDHAFIQSLRFPTHINIENVTSMNTRTCAITSSDYSFMRIYNCTFDNCGKNITPSWLDLEDGYEYGHNLFIDNCKVINSPSTIDCICQFADNLVVENCTNLSFSLAKCKNVTFRNNTTTKTFVMSKCRIVYNGFRRVYNNITNGNTELQAYEYNDKYLQYLRIIKDNEIHGIITANNAEYGLDKIVGGSVIDGTISGGLLENVNIVSGKVSGNVTKILDKCTFNCSFGGNAYTYIKNSRFTEPTILTGNIDNCVFEKNVNINGNCNLTNCGELIYTTKVDGDIVYGERFVVADTFIYVENCTINFNCSNGSLVGIGDQRNKYANTHSTTFKNCIINMTDGSNLMNGYYNMSQDWFPTDTGYTVNFINCTINGNYSERGNRLVGYEDRYIINYINE